MKTIISAIAFSLFAYPLVLNAGQTQEVVVYTSVDDLFARPIATRFENETGIKVKLVPDTEETKSTGLLNRLIMEKERPQADVFWSGDPVRAAVLKKKGVSIAYKSPKSKGLPPIFSDAEGFWTGFSSRARVLLVNTEKLKGKLDPKSIYDLADPKYKGLGCIANPLFGTTSMHAAAIFEVLGAEKAKAFFESLVINKVRMLSSNGEVRRRVSSGDCGFGLTDTDDAFEAIRDKKPVKVIFADENGLGSLIVPNAAVLIKQGPHLTNGKKFIDYLISPEVEQILAESDAAQIPVRAGVKVPAHVRSLQTIRTMNVNYEKLGDILEDISKSYLKAWADRVNQ